MNERIKRVLAESSARGMVLRSITRAFWHAAEGLTAIGDRFALRHDMSAFTPAAVRSLLQRNAQYANCHKGERCFILGTGPSLQGQNLALLKNETVFATNLGYRYLADQPIRPKYYVIVDRLLLEPASRESLRAISAYARRCGSTLFVEGNVPDLPHEVLNGADVRYLHSMMRARDYARAKRPVPIDPTRALPGFESVIHACVTLCLYMGFEKVYLLGCDMDYFAKPNEIYTHAYPETPESLSVTTELFREDQIDLMRRATWEFETLRALDKIARANGQAIYNATAGGYMEVVQRVDFASLFAEGPR